MKKSPEKKKVTYSPRKWPEMTESTSSDDVPITMYRGSWVVEIVPGTKKTVTYSPRKWPEMTESTSSYDVPITVYRGSWILEIVPEAKNCDLSPTKTARLDRIDKFW